MNAERPNVRRILFGVFELDPSSGELYKHGIRIKLQDQPLQVLGLLLERPGEVVTRDELRQRIWDQDTFVDFDHSLNISINKLRDALGDSASSPRFIETLPRRGYRFIGSVRDPQPSGSSPALSPAPEVSSTSPASIPDTGVGTASATTTSSSVNHVAFNRRWYVPAAVLLIVAMAAVWFWQRNRDPLQRRRVMLAVLPFENLAPDQNEAYFVAGLHDELIAQLGRLHPSRLGVIARTSVIQYAKERKPVDQIGRELHVDYVLDGAIRRVGDRFRITAELIQVSDQTHLWTETYEPNMSDMLGMQEDVARRVSQAIAIEFLPEAQQEFRQASTSNAAAYEAYLKGRYLWHQETRSSLEAAIAQFQRAIELDSNYGPAYVGLADAYGVMGGYGFVPADQVLPKAKAAAAKALELAPNLAEAYNSMAFVSFYYDWDWNEAERLFRKSIALNPNNSLAHEFFSSFLHAMGRLDEAETENRIAKELDPLDSWLYDDRGWMFLSRRHPESAIPEFRKAIELNSNFPAAHLSLAVAYNRTRQFAQALEEVKKAEALSGDPTRVLEVLGSAQALSGDVTGAKATLDKLLSGNIQGRVSPYSVALIYNVMGNKAEAINWLERGYREKDTWIVWTGTLVEWDNLRLDPRFVELQRQLRLPPRS